MKTRFFISVLMLNLVIIVTLVLGETVTLEKSVLKDKIMGGWAGQLVGCTFGGPTEFKFNSTIIPDYYPIEWNDNPFEWWYDNAPGLYDDIYMDLTFVQVFEEQGLDAPANDFAKAFAHAEYPLWHANQAARYNILNGIMPPESGHWLNNPHADDIDFQIEADFAGLMCPGMVNKATEFCDRIGHIMNYGDGWYGGVYVAAMYSLAFISDDIDYIVNEALKAIPEQSQYYKCMRDVIDFHRMYSGDWKRCWFEIQQKWGEDIGCPSGVFTSFNIDAKINSAWILLGLLYGDGDFAKTLSISTRAGDDSDCNPASAGGILGTVIGYKNIPNEWKQGINKVVKRDFKYTSISLYDTYSMSFNHALKVVEKNGGSIEKDKVIIHFKPIQAVPLEIGFEGHYPIERKKINRDFISETNIEFDGIGFALQGSIFKHDNKDCELEVEMYIDGQLLETSVITSVRHDRKNPLFWRYQLPNGSHSITLKIAKQSENAGIHLNDMIIYGKSK